MFWKFYSANISIRYTIKTTKNLLDLKKKKRVPSNLIIFQGVASKNNRIPLMVHWILGKTHLFMKSVHYGALTVGILYLNYFIL